MKKILILTIGLLTTLVATAEVKIYDDNIEQRSEGLSLNKVVFVDHDLNRVELIDEAAITKAITKKPYSRHQTIKVSLQKAGARRAQSGSLEVWSVLKNHTDYDLQVEGRAMFFDADEVPLDDQTAWKRLYIPANSFGTYRDFSISQNARFFIIELREGQ